jgi:diguanylate cyclase
MDKGELGKVRNRNFDTRVSIAAIGFLTLIETVIIAVELLILKSDVTTCLLSFLCSLAIAGIALRALRSSRHREEQVENSRQKAEQLAGFDTMSGLPNRRTFREQLEECTLRLKPGGMGLAVHFLDLDRFKHVNDTFGHAAGDELIAQFAGRMKDLLRGADLVARFGGDEFAIMQTGVSHRREAEALARRILAATAEPFQLAAGSAHIGVSVGIALAPDQARDIDSLMRFADIALYTSKHNGRNRFSTFVETMDRQLHLRTLVTERLKDALANGDIKVHYLPQFSVETSTLVGFEALIRWNDATYGEITPDELIPIAVSTGQINLIGEWVLKQACMAAMKWPRHIRVSVNIAPIHFKNSEFVNMVTRTVREVGIDPNRVELELTEAAIVKDEGRAEDIIMELRALGVRFVLDDFGTGYASLIYLRRFAFDMIKIDQSFLCSTEETGESAVIILSIIQLARALGLTVSAEGIETAEQFRFLQTIGCQLAQGQYLAEPQSADDILKKLANEWKPAPMKIVATRAA